MDSGSRRLMAAVAVGILVLGAALPGRLHAAAKTVEEIANYDGADRQAMLEAGAKQEGEVMVYTTGAQTDPILNRFSEIYPFIRLQAFRPGGGSDVTRRVLEEYKAGVHVVDALLFTTSGLQTLRDADILQPYHTPDFVHYKEEAIEPHRLWVVDKESYVGLGYNTKTYAESQLPKTYDDLLDPKWKGKFAIARGDTLAFWIGVVVLTKGEDFLRKFGTQEPVVYNVSGRGLSNMVVSGEAPISPTIYDGHMFESRNKGASVDWRAIGAVYANIDADALAKNAPHPHAGMLLIDFMQSKEGQAMYQKLGYKSARTDMESKGKPEKTLYLTERPNYNQEFEYWTKLGTEIFRGGKKVPEKN